MEVGAASVVVVVVVVVAAAAALVVVVYAAADFDASSSHLDLLPHPARLSCLPLEATSI